MPSLLDQINDQIRELRSENREVEEAVDDQIKKQRAMDQSRIAWVIIWAFVVAIGSIFILVIGGLLFGAECGEGQVDCDPARWESPATFLLGIVSSVTRHPAVTAMEMATLGRAFPGRLTAGIGHGVPAWTQQMGVYPRSPLSVLREVVTTIRRLLEGETVEPAGDPSRKML